MKKTTEQTIKDTLYYSFGSFLHKTKNGYVIMDFDDRIFITKDHLIIKKGRRQTAVVDDAWDARETQSYLDQNYIESYVDLIYEIKDLLITKKVQENQPEASGKTTEELLKELTYLTNIVSAAQDDLRDGAEPVEILTIVLKSLEKTVDVTIKLLEETK